MVNELDSLESSICSFKIEFLELEVGSGWNSSKTYELFYGLWEYDFAVCYLTWE